MWWNFASRRLSDQILSLLLIHTFKVIAQWFSVFNRLGRFCCSKAAIVLHRSAKFIIVLCKPVFLRIAIFGQNRKNQKYSLPRAYLQPYIGPAMIDPPLPPSRMAPVVFQFHLLVRVQQLRRKLQQPINELNPKIMENLAFCRQTNIPDLQHINLHGSQDSSDLPLGHLKETGSGKR